MPDPRAFRWGVAVEDQAGVVMGVRDLLPLSGAWALRARAATVTLP